jgi:tetratricopeptide (TPR) repeat protein
VGKSSESNEGLQQLPQLNRQLENGSEKNIEIFLEQVTSLRKDALGGNKKAVQDMQQLLERARADYPGHPLVDAYYGLTMILIAKDKTSPLGKLKGTKAGLKILDEAVSAAPQDGRIRLLRGRAAYRLPEKYFQRSQTVIDDYTFLIDREMHEEGFLKTENYLQLLYELGEVYCRIGRNQAAIICWKRLKNETQDPDFLHLLELKLKSLEGKPAVEHIPNTESIKSILIRRTVRAVGSELLSLVGHQKKEETPRRH